MDRRDALRAATALAAGSILSGCSGPTRPPADTPAASSPPPPVPQATTRAPGTAREISHGPRDSRTVALTFHGQGDPVLAGRLLDELDRGGARVTVLAVGSWLGTQHTLAQRILADGHELGNHTQHHADISAMAPEQAYAEIHDCAQALTAATGSIGRWFRPSRTRHATPMIRSQAAAAGYATCLSYDVDSLDYTDPAPDAIVRTTLRAVQGGSIVSLHLGHEATVAAIPALLGGLRRRGLTPVTMSELIT
ncbi:polysaccharide deacetylase family protein [Krasilnikovia sp. MM14-A1259]|uniref:polysaccharide deacetylase family protein n=1 Tax=Krasilnikovia sp. MM14-A1259 TaxID=3373539 RepID=UPI00399CB5E0